MSDLKQLYQEVILDHSKRPRNCHVLEHASHQAEGHNPLCGDHITLYLDIEQNIIKDISFKGSGCAISTASVSMLTENLKGKTIEEARAIFTKFRELVTGEDQKEGEPLALGKLCVFEGVKEFPVRVKCATLSWHTFEAALNNSTAKVKTE